MKKKKQQQKKKVEYTYSKNWNSINLLPTVLLLIGLFVTVILVSAKTYYDFRQHAKTPEPVVSPSIVEEVFDILSPTPTITPTPTGAE